LIGIGGEDVLSEDRGPSRADWELVRVETRLVRSVISRFSWPAAGTTASRATAELLTSSEEVTTERDSPWKGAAMAEAAMKATERKLTAFILMVDGLNVFERRV
jgi:hypothetical protein